MKEDVYTKYSEGDPEVSSRDEAMEKAMPSAEKIYERFVGIKTLVKDAPEGKLHLDLRCLQAAREIWQHLRNPYIATNDASHPNNWTRHQLLTIAGTIQKHMGMPIYDLEEKP